MLHLAQVQRNPTSGEIGLRLLAYQKGDRFWGLGNSKFLPLEEDGLSEGLLILVELSENFNIIEMENAKDWIVNLVQQHLTKEAMTSEFIEAEQARLEQWRQELTSQSQDLTRLRLEMETRREQLQELEANLKLEREKLQLDGDKEE